jgi:hypothetical protein
VFYSLQFKIGVQHSQLNFCNSLLRPSTSSENIEEMAVVSGWGKTRESKFSHGQLKILFHINQFLSFAIFHYMKTFYLATNISNRRPVGSTDQACSNYNFFRIA